jgi:hypothetical protein
MGFYCAICDRCGAIAPIAAFEREYAAKLPQGWRREGPCTYCPDCAKRIQLERLGQARR